MSNFRKLYNLIIISIACILLQANLVYSSTNTLRDHVGQADSDDTLPRMAEAMEIMSNGGGIASGVLPENNEDHSDFAKRMALANEDKIRMLDFVVEGSIIELGVGIGNITGLLMKKFPDSKIVGIEYEPSYLQQASQLYPDASFYLRDITNWDDFDNFKGKFNTVIISSMLHEIDVIYGREASEQIFKAAYDLLKPGGVLIFRDGVKPENKEQEVEIILKTPYAKEKFERFIKEYRHRDIKYSYVDEAKTHVIVSSYDLHDILCKYYFEGDLWERDMDESFGQMSDKQYGGLIGKYFDITHSETYVASYLKNLWERDFEVVNGGYPNSHILIVAKKPSELLINNKLQDQRTTETISESEAKEVLKSLGWINQETGVLDQESINIVAFNGDSEEFTVDTFIEEVNRLESNQIASIIITDADKRKVLETNPIINSMLKESKAFFTELNPDSPAFTQWTNIIGDRLSCDFKQEITQVSDIINNKELYKELAAAK